MSKVTVAAGFSFGNIIQDSSFWSWFNSHKSDPVISVKILFIPIVTLSVGDLESLFVRIFGQNPGI